MIAKTTNCRPSTLLGVKDEWTAYQLDCAVSTVGLAIEAASMERVNLGDDKEPDWQNKYTMKELLDPLFKLPSQSSWGLEDDLPFMDGFKYDEVR